MTEYRFIPRNVSKYAGNPMQIVARSKWELQYMAALDSSPMVHRWLSEPKNLHIQYLNPIDRKIHEYWPDFLVQYTDGNVEILEVKPLKQALAEKATNTYDKLSLIKNVAKWNAAEKFAKTIGARFRVITEKSLFKKKATMAPKRPAPTRKPQLAVKKRA